MPVLREIFPEAEAKLCLRVKDKLNHMTPKHSCQKRDLIAKGTQIATAVASNLRAIASDLKAMASNLVAMASS